MSGGWASLAVPEGACAVELAGEQVLLLPQKALYWPRMRLLAVADIHFGKAASFRALGVPVPRGTTTENLALLDLLLAAHDVAHVMFLGDFLHARSAHAPATLAVLSEWRTRRPALRLTLVRGNHDLRAGDPPPQLGIELVDEPHWLAPFAFCHHPELAEPAAPGYVLAGHVHPVFHLAARGDALRLPCFLIGEQRAVLPSFGAFTGGHAVRPAAGERVFLVAGDMVLAHAKLTVGR
ncbi:DEAD/DEAH box helicase [Massilia sp. Root351]|uniref:ligase-associated DNA damage response endonuclease PdeM n=1 Tax=Massilia sp. Root351 TaxID=1736522 RepID=UPI00071011D1|nr:ligase-associated DNA damage response endonuclease PdeM [Massilia sp. Root351]KQV80366.1 DEAD/DEAH box helicase [Massilia sp. Root351]